MFPRCVSVCKRFGQCASTVSTPCKTSLYDFHVANGGKMVNFAGFLLPVQYSNQSISASHLHTRQQASLFDVSHMLQTDIIGESCAQYLETMVTADVQGLPEGHATLTLYTDANGGILDDLIVTKIAQNHLFVVSNAGRRVHDMQHMQNTLQAFRTRSGDENLHLRFYDPSERALVAVQGPKAVVILQNMTDCNLAEVFFMQSRYAKVAGVDGCRITRCGYTGEDGFEISMPAKQSAGVAKALLASGEVRLAGLGARDSLRLEAGLCLYGSDVTTQTSPVDAALTWLVDKRRRQVGDFPGAERILEQIKNGSVRKRIGLVSDSGPPARHDTGILSEDGQHVGVVTSGCPAPSLGKNIAMGYVPVQFAKVGTVLQLQIRGKLYEARVAKMPFVNCHYYRKESI